MLTVLRALGHTEPDDQARVTVGFLRTLFERGEYRPLVGFLRILGYTDVRAWALLEEWAAEYGRDPAAVWADVWAPAMGRGE